MLRRDLAVRRRFVPITANRGRLCRSSLSQGSGTSLSTVWLARSPSLSRKRLHQTRGLTRSHIESFPICGAHIVTTLAATHRAKCRAEWPNKAAPAANYVAKTTWCLVAFRVEYRPVTADGEVSGASKNCCSAPTGAGWIDQGRRRNSLTTVPRGFTTISKVDFPGSRRFFPTTTSVKLSAS